MDANTSVDTGTDLVVRDVRDAGYHILRLNRPEKMNALNRDMYTALTNGLRAGEDDDDIGAHVLLGQPGAFSSGNDIADFANAVLEHGVSGLSDSVLAFVRLLPRLKKPLIAGVDGLAIGIGTTVLFHCDMVFATERSRFATPFVDLGLVPEAGSSVLGPARLGYVRAFELLAGGVEKDASWMFEAGAINALVSEADLEGVANRAAANLAAKARPSLLATKALMHPNRKAIIDQIEREAEIFADRLKSPEAMLAFQSFLSGQGRG